MNNIWLALITGLTTGGLSCLAVQGGLLASSVSQNTEEEIVKTKKWQKVSMFLIAKIVAYTLLGLGLGTLGSTLVLSPTLLGFMQILAGLFMIATAGRLLNLHPVFRYFVVKPPKWAFKLAKTESKNKSLFAPAILGFLTILIPCGVTQSMMVLATASANPLYGAGIMFAFTLGTSPIFFAMGYAVEELFKRKTFVYITSIAILFLGFMSINTGQILRGSPHNAQNYWKAVFNSNSYQNGKLAEVVNGKQEVEITATSNGYTTDNKVLKVGVPTKLTITSKNVQTCVRSFIIPSLKVFKNLPENGEITAEFTPTKSGLLSFNCGMGMYKGDFTVIN